MESEVLSVLALDKTSSEQHAFIIKKVKEKTEQQLEYILSSINENIFLEACAGSGKTEVVGMKTAFEINRWGSRKGRIAVLTFTNEATTTIKNRVEQFAQYATNSGHFIGTLTGFIHGFIAQKFGYKYLAHKKQNDDGSYSLIDKGLDVHTNHWLENYTLSIPYVTSSGKKLKLYAHQIYYDFEVNDYIIDLSNENKISITDYYNSEKFQQYLQDLREKNNKQWLFQFDYVKQIIIELKAKFFKGGFANFEDMNNIAYQVLSESMRLSSLISAKFPLIFVDECQDLSWIEINILNKLRRAGTILHFIGDLNQAIYDFKGAKPDYTKSFVSDFIRTALTNNFRSCHTIVEVVNRISSINLPTKGFGESKLINSICYIEYSDLDELLERYCEFLKQVKINIKSSAVLVRQQTLKDKLDKRNIKSPHFLVDALQLWKTKNPINRKLALELAGQQLHKWFDGSRATRKNYYCPIGISSVYRWRIFIKDYLESFNQYPVLLEFENKTYSEWYKEFNKLSSTLIQRPYKNLQKYDTVQRDFNLFPTYRTPNGTSSKLIISHISTARQESLTVNTIHSVKGKAYDGVMVVSSEHNGSGHWKQWIQQDGEPRRIGYVASTRAKYSLVWAIPNLSTEDRITIESYGFMPIDFSKLSEFEKLLVPS